ncbi:MAG: radical SAM protein [Nitrospirae bacterium]|nr:radical SAM protein [Nitrospirota bacterium]
MDNIYNIDDISYTLTEFCPGHCRYCSIWKLPDKRQDELKSQELDLLFSSKYLSIKKIHLTGGEPHKSPTYIRAVDSIHKYLPETVIDTPISGWYPDLHEETARYVTSRFPLYRLDISLDGDEKIYGKIRLYKDGFAKAVETAKRLRAIPGMVVRFQFTIYVENYHLINWVYEFAKSLGVGLYIGFGRFNPDRFKNSFDNLTNRELTLSDFVPPKEIRQEIYKRLAEIGFDKSRYASKYYWQQAIWEKNPVRFDCYMGRRSIDIDPYGNVYPCLLWLPELRMGNIREAGSLDAVLESETASNILAIIGEGGCKTKCLYTCALKAKIIEPSVPAHGLKDYDDKYGFVFDENDLIPLAPWWDRADG